MGRGKLVKTVERVQVIYGGVLYDAKRCTGCNEIRLLKDYHRKKPNVDGRAHVCKFCTSTQRRKAKYACGGS